MVFTQSGARDFLDKITGIIEANLSNEQFGVNELSQKMGMSRSNLHRKIKSATGISISQFIQQVRLKKALELLQQTSSTVSEVAFECGFHSVSYFTTCFHDHYGFPPGKAGKSEADQYNLSVNQQHHLKPGFSKKRLTIILSSAIFVIIAVLVLFFIFRPFTTRNRSLNKSIAVLPFINDSPEETEMYFINGTMEAILDNLSKIEDLRVVSRTSVEQYRNNLKSSHEIAKEMGVSYILEGSGLKQGDNIRLTVQLIDAIKDRQIWSQTYEKKTEEVLELYSDIPQLVASKIEATVTPEEKQLIEKTPTTSLTAYDFFQTGREEYWKYFFNEDEKALERAENLYHEALEYDSTFAQAYTGLATVYWSKHYLEEYFSESFMDSVLILTNIALSYDEHLAEAYDIRGSYFIQKGLVIQALKEYDKAIRFNPNDWMAYASKAFFYIYIDDDLVKGIENSQKASSLSPQSELKIGYLGGVCWAYTIAGFPEKAKYYAQEKFKLESDSAAYIGMLGVIEYYLGNFEKAIELFEKTNELIEKANTMDSYNNTKNLEFLGECYYMYGHYEESLKYFKKFYEVSGALIENSDNKASWIGYVYWKNGYKEEAEYYINEFFNLIKRGTEFGQEGWDLGLVNYFFLAGIYAFKGENDKVIENLKIFNQKPRINLMWLFYIKNDPLFDNIRNEPEFQRIVRDMEAKYQTEHEKVRKWLEEQGMD